jgi:hypothetical protein
MREKKVLFFVCVFMFWTFCDEEISILMRGRRRRRRRSRRRHWIIF